MSSIESRRQWPSVSTWRRLGAATFGRAGIGKAQAGSASLGSLQRCKHGTIDMRSRYRRFRHLPHPYAIWSDKRQSCDYEDMLHRVLVLEVLLRCLFFG